MRGWRTKAVFLIGAWMVAVAGCSGPFASFRLPRSDDDAAQPAATAEGADQGADGVGAMRADAGGADLRANWPEDAPVEVIWSVPLAGHDLAVEEIWLPAGGDADPGSLFVLSPENDLVSFRRGSGEAQWLTRLSGRPLGPPRVSEHAAYVVAGGHLLCMEIHEGDIFWRLRTEFPPSGNLVVRETERNQPRIVMAAQDRMVHGMTVEQTLWPPQGGIGEISRTDIVITRDHLYHSWHFPIDGIVEGPIGSNRGMVYVADSSGAVYALNLRRIRSGRPEEAWEVKTRGPNSAGVVARDAYVLVASRDRTLYCFSRHGGDRPVWRFPTGQILVEPPVWIPDPAVNRPFVLQRGREGTLFCLEGTTGKELWRVDGAARVCGVDRDTDRPAAEQTAAVVQYADGAIRAHRLATGAEVWSLPAGLVGKTAAQAIDTMVYAASPQADRLIAIGRIED